MKLGTTDISVIKLGGTGISKAYLGSSVVFEENSKKQFYFEYEEGTGTTAAQIIFLSTTSYSSGGYSPYVYNSNASVEISSDGVNWETKSFNMEIVSSSSRILFKTPIIHGSKLYMRNLDLKYRTGYYYDKNGKKVNVNGVGIIIGYSSESGVIVKIGGNLSTLFLSDTDVYAGRLFSSNRYNEMYLNNDFIIDKIYPDNPSYGCYEEMFYGDKNITSCDLSLATNPTDRSFTGLFMSCSNLNQLKVSFTSWPTNGYGAWVYGVSSTGTFICPSSLPQTRGTSYIPNNWTVQTY